MPAKLDITDDERKERQRIAQREYHKRMRLSRRPIQGLFDEEPKQQTPLEFMLSIVNSPNEPISRRMRMAIAAAPYCHENLSKRPADKKLGIKQARQQAADEANKGHFATSETPLKLVFNNDDEAS